MRFRADGEILAARGANHEAHVVVPVSRHVGTFGNPVAIEIEDFGFDDEIRQAGFFFGLAQGDTAQIDIAIGMATQLQPPIQLAMVGQERALSVGADQPGGSGEVATQAFTQESMPPFLQQVEEQIRRSGLRRPGLTTGNQGGRKGLPFG